MNRPNDSFLDGCSAPLRSWRSGGFSLRPLHDAAHRPIGLLINEAAGEPLVSLSFFCDGLSDLPVRNYTLLDAVTETDTMPT